jgi:hypothetical protein
MDTKERLTTLAYQPEHRSALIEFCEHAGEQGYKNNRSLEAMRLDWCINTGGQFFVSFLGEKIVSVSGCHPLPEVGDCFRVLFRGATLNQYQNYYGIPSKTHMGSIPFYDHLPLQISWANKDVVVTTNWNNPDGIVSMGHSHRVFKLLEKQGLVSCLTEKINLFNTDQAVWKINQAAYFKARTGYQERNGLH